MPVYSGRAEELHAAWEATGDCIEGLEWAVFWGKECKDKESGKACHWYEGAGPEQKLIGWALTAREGRSGWVFCASGICGS